LNELLAVSFIVSLFFYVFIFVAADPSPSIFVSPSSKTVGEGDTFTVDINVTDVTDLYSWQFKLYYKKILTCQSVMEGPFLSSGGFGTFFPSPTINNSYNSTHGRIDVGCSRLGRVPGETGSGVLATITFKALSAGSTTLHLFGTGLWDPPGVGANPISHTTIDGAVHVTGAPNNPPSAINLKMTPSTPTTNDNLFGSYSYYDVDGDPESGSEIRWYKNGVLQSAYNDMTAAPSSATRKGETWNFTVKPKDGVDFGTLQISPSVTVQNSPPLVSGVSISPSSPKTTDNLVGSYSYYDADGDPESGTEIRWYRDDVLQSAYNDQLVIPYGSTNDGQVWCFTVKPKDGEDFGTLNQSPYVTIGRVNNAPVASNLTVSPAVPYTTGDLKGSYDYYDADGDAESGSETQWYKNNVLQPAFNNKLIIPSNETSQGETWYFTVKPKDGKDFGAVQTSPTVTIFAAEQDVAVIEVLPWKTVVGQGCPLYINVKVENQAGSSVVFNVTAYGNTTIIQTTTVTLNGYNSTIIVVAWNTTGLAKGGYTVSACAMVLPGETDVSDNTYVYGIVFVTIPGDLNCDHTVNIIDLWIAASAFNSKLGDERWNSNADVNDDAKINIIDLFQLGNWWWRFQLAHYAV